MLLAPVFFSLLSPLPAVLSQFNYDIHSSLFCSQVPNENEMLEFIRNANQENGAATNNTSDSVTVDETITDRQKQVKRYCRLILKIIVYAFSLKAHTTLRPELLIKIDLYPI